ncbi:hypothetical protein C2E23DRAFT_100156 [Lenzites betulinus]|nr:hypothetical protein C2E23DRAFT_100156 [Lenzites betulinus]
MMHSWTGDCSSDAFIASTPDPGFNAGTESALLSDVDEKPRRCYKPTCPPSNSQFAPLFNERRQDPCTIFLDLAGACVGGQLTPANIPQLANNPCVCNSVMYSLAYVCGICSNTEWLQVSSSTFFKDYFKCSAPVYDEYPALIPPDTAIPAWAYLPLDDVSGKVDLNAARSRASQNPPDATTQGSYGSSPSQGSPQNVPTNAPTTTPGQTPPELPSATDATLTAPSTTKSPVTNSRTPISTTNSSTPATMTPTIPASAQTPTSTGVGGPAISKGPDASPFGLTTDSTLTLHLTDSHPTLSFQPEGTTTATESTGSPNTWFFMSRAAFIRTSAGLSAAAFVMTIIVIFLFRRDRRICKAEKLAQRARPSDSPSSGDRQWRRLECADECTPELVSWLDVLEPLRLRHVDVPVVRNVPRTYDIDNAMSFPYR